VKWGLYGLSAPPAAAPEFVAAVARRRGLLRAGGQIDEERTAAAVLKDFREGRLGRMTLELPPGADTGERDPCA
jgi:ribosome biogenesis GTPase A